MEWIKNWVSSICITVILITAVELIVPENKMDKYVKFVVGLILIAVIINPIIKLVSYKSDINDYVDKAMTQVNNAEVKSSIDNYKKDNLKSTSDTFEANLEKTCTKALKEKFPENEYEAKFIIEYDSEKGEFLIDSAKINVKEIGVTAIKKVDVNAAINDKEASDETTKNIKAYVSSEFKIDEDKISVVEDNE